MAENKDDIEIAKLQTVLEYIKNELHDIKTALKEINLSTVSLRSDVNLANSRSMDNKVKIEALGLRLNDLEKIVDQRRTLESFFKWLIGVLGISGVVALLAALTRV